MKVSKDLEIQNMQHANEIITILDGVSNEGYQCGWSDREWTIQIKNRVCSLGNDNKYWTYASSCQEANGGEWLFDVIWLNYSNNKLMNIEMALESEWNIAGIDDDFQKLLVAKSELRVMIFQHLNKESCKEKIEDLIDQIAKFSQTQVGDKYLFSCWIRDQKKFIHESFQY